MRYFSPLRLLVVVLLMAATASPSAGYIHFPPLTMPKMCQTSTCIRVLSVKKHDKDRGVIIYEAVETLKGETPAGMSFKHVIQKDAEGVKPIYDWVADGKRAVMFTIEGRNISCGYVFIGEFCYSVDHNKRDNYWLLIRTDPEMSACFHGSVEELQKVAKDLLEGKDVKVPVKEGVSPLSLKEREKRVKDLNDILNKNRPK